MQVYNVTCDSADWAVGRQPSSRSVLTGECWTDFSSCLMAILDQNLYVAGLFANEEEVNLIDEAVAAMTKRMVLCLFSISWITVVSLLSGLLSTFMNDTNRDAIIVVDNQIPVYFINKQSNGKMVNKTAHDLNEIIRWYEIVLYFNIIIERT